MCSLCALCACVCACSCLVLWCACVLPCLRACPVCACPVVCVRGCSVCPVCMCPCYPAIIPAPILGCKNRGIKMPLYKGSIRPPYIGVLFLAFIFRSENRAFCSVFHAFIIAFRLFNSVFSKIDFIKPLFLWKNSEIIFPNYFPALLFQGFNFPGLDVYVIFCEFLSSE